MHLLIVYNVIVSLLLVTQLPHNSIRNEEHFGNNRYTMHMPELQRIAVCRADSTTQLQGVLQCSTFLQVSTTHPPSVNLLVATHSS